MVVDGDSSLQNLTWQGDLCLVENTVPLLDFVVEGGNRLWGCRFGTNRKGETVNEIYASALGSFRVWEKFEGISDDSYTLSCGTDGPFTGAAVYGGNPIFFKENYMHRVYGTFPFSVTPAPCNGVQLGSHRSLAVVNNRLFYKSVSGICVYNGSAPVLLELPFGEESYHSAVGAGNQTYYYLMMTSEDGSQVLFVYDTQKGILTKEKGLPTGDMACFGEEIFAMCRNQDQYYLVCLTGVKGKLVPLEQQVTWFAESGVFGMDTLGKGYMQGLELTLSLPVGSTFSAAVCYDSCGVYEPLFTLCGKNTRHVTLPLRLRQCDHFQLKFSGEGDFTLHALNLTTRKGGNALCI